MERVNRRPAGYFLNKVLVSDGPLTHPFGIHSSLNEEAIEVLHTWNVLYADKHRHRARDLFPSSPAGPLLPLPSFYEVL